MVIVFVEDKALKLFVEKLCSRLRIPCRPRMPVTGGGGWTGVLERVRDTDPKEFRIVGIIEGDARKKAEKIEFWDSVSNRIFITRKNELEDYLYEKRERIVAMADLTPGTTYPKFKHFFNKDAPEITFNRILSDLSKQDCEEITSLVAFIKGC